MGPSWSSSLFKNMITTDISVIFRSYCVCCLQWVFFFFFFFPKSFPISWVDCCREISSYLYLSMLLLLAYLSSPGLSCQCSPLSPTVVILVFYDFSVYFWKQLEIHYWLARPNIASPEPQLTITSDF